MGRKYEMLKIFKTQKNEKGVCLKRDNNIYDEAFLFCQ